MINSSDATCHIGYTSFLREFDKNDLYTSTNIFELQIYMKILNYHL